MRFSEAIQEFGFDCRARELSDKTNKERLDRITERE